eukprot:c47445_g1_i1.p1 GENE.c47445_g1_i1~~c47445_g1_i1.p1  ORF type:complete len:220 (-),score=45.70 c47445_g1_i1:44-703(-)
MNSFDLFAKVFTNMGNAVLEKVKAAAAIQMPSAVLDFADDQVRLIAKTQQQSAESENGHLLDAIWHRFDADNNGQLDEGECKKLVIEFLNAAVDAMPKVLTVTMTEMVKMQVAAMSQSMKALLGDDLTAAELDAALGQMMADVSRDAHSAIATMATAIHDHIQESLREDKLKAFSEEMHLALDANGDNIIVKDEFTSHFLKWLNDMELIPSEVPLTASF